MSVGDLASKVPGKVLVVDDDSSVRESLAATLSLEFTVASAAGVGDAVAALGAGGFDVVVTDYEMPGGSGIELARRVGEQFPGVIVILLTGYPENAEVKEWAHSPAIIRLLTKPHDPARLTEMVHRTVTVARMRQAINRIAGSAP